jgi:endogenous inhibitor of DNA gyrase (YacG/DUF329 family)
VTETLTITCEGCGEQVAAQRTTKRFCSNRCYRMVTLGYPRSRDCRHCGTAFQVAGRGDANRWHCSKQCAKTRQTKTVRDWQKAHPEEMRGYWQARTIRNPGMWTQKARDERRATLDLLGGACVVCGADNPAWLHVDYIPTTRNMRYRHPRNIAYVRRNLTDFRILCANHHYELTLTGRIEGTDITQ